MVKSTNNDIPDAIFAGAASLPFQYGGFVNKQVNVPLGTDANVEWTPGRADLEGEAIPTGLGAVATVHI